MNLSPCKESREFISTVHEPATYIDRYAYLIGRNGFLTPAGEAIELLDMQPVWWVPNLPPHIRGITSIHGFLVPALDLEVLFGEPSAAPSRWLLVLGREQSAVALLIHSLPVKKRFNNEDRSAPANCPAALIDHIRGAYPGTPAGSAGNLSGLWLDFNHQSYFDSGEAFS